MSDQTGIAGAATYTPTGQPAIPKRYGPKVEHPRLTVEVIDKLIASGGSYNALDLLRQLREALEVVERLPKTKDGVPIIPGSECWFWFSSDDEYYSSGWSKVEIERIAKTDNRWCVEDGEGEFPLNELFSAPPNTLASKGAQNA